MLGERPVRAGSASTAGRALWIVATVVALIVLAAILWRFTAGRRDVQVAEKTTTAPTPPADRDARKRPDAPGTQGAVGAESASPATGGVADALGAALERGDVPAAQLAATELRRKLRTDADAWRKAVDLLLADSTPTLLRQAIAMVLGTIADPDPDPSLITALARFGAQPDVARALLLALGANRQPDDVDDVFRMSDRPWGASGPGGLAISVRRQIADDAVRAKMAAYLRREEPSVRRAAVLALRHSLSSQPDRTNFADVLGSEREDIVAQELGEALVIAGRRSEDPAERDRLIGLVLRRAADDALHGLRFKIEDDLKSTSLEPDERRALSDLAASAQSFEKRAFALTVLAGGAHLSGEDALREARALLVAQLTSDADAAVRDLSARLVASVEPDESSIAVLGRVAHEDRAWNVRFTALSTLARAAKVEVARAALVAGAEDADKRVADHARKLLETLKEE